jgi:integrase
MKKEISLQELHSNFIKEGRDITHLRAETLRGYENTFILLLRLVPEIDSVSLLTDGNLRMFFTRLDTRVRKIGRGIEKSGVKKSTTKTYWSKLNTFFNWLNRKGLLKINPLKAIKPPRVRYTSNEKFEKDEVNKIYTAIINNSKNSLMSKRDIFMVSLLYYTGIRKGEFISLQVKDIDFYKKLITIRGETSKSCEPRTLPIHATLFLHLKDYMLERNNLGYKTEFLIVSTTKDKGLSVDGLKHWTERLERLTGMDFHLHMFRHTFACSITDGGVPTASLQKLMGHFDIKMTSRYTRSLKPEKMTDEISKISL